jgi:branched chain amino acid efflux pump
VAGVIALTIVVIGVGTYLMRVSFIAFVGDRPVPAALERPLRYVAPAAMAALAFQPTLVRHGELAIDPSNLRIWALLVAFFVAWKTRNIALVIVGALVALAVLDWFV